jgi:hypothetical protein
LATAASVTAAQAAATAAGIAGGGLVAAAPTSIANSGGTSSLTSFTTTFTGVTSVSLNGVFSSNYSNYLIKAEILGSVSSASMTTRYRSSGVDTSTGYTIQDFSANSTTLTGLRSSTSSATIGSLTSDDPSGYSIEIYNPNLAKSTSHSSLNAYGRLSAFLTIVVGTQTSTTVFDGITLFPTSGTATGTVTVYGYAK